MMSLLLRMGADVNAKGAWDLTPLHYAVVFDHPDIVSGLLGAGADPNITDANGRTALDHARLENNCVAESTLIAAAAAFDQP